MVLIVGGGIIGLSIAWKLIEIGKKVIILEKNKLGQEASWAAAGLLAGRIEAEPSEEKLLPLLLKSQSRWPDFAKEIELESGEDIGYKQDGTIMVASNIDEENQLKSNFEFLKKQNINLDWINGKKIRDLEPYVSNKIISGIFSKMDHHVNNQNLLKALISIIKKKKSKCIIKENTEVKEIISQDNLVKGAQTNKEFYKASHVIVCSGAWSNKIKNVEKKEVPVRPIKGQMICLKMNPKEPIIQHVLWKDDVYLVPRSNSDLIIGATVEEMGFDKTLTAGGLLHLLKNAQEIVPGIENLPIIDTWSGLRPTSRDDAPIIGESKKTRGLIFATGHHRNGILLTPLTCDALKGYFLDGKFAKDFTSFKPDRFLNN